MVQGVAVWVLLPPIAARAQALALRLDGSDDHVSTGAIDPGPTYTVEAQAWVRTGALPTWLTPTRPDQPRETVAAAPGRACGCASAPPTALGRLLALGLTVRPRPSTRSRR
jgi:hypothetical protein